MSQDNYQDVEMVLLTFDGVPEVQFPIPALHTMPEDEYQEQRRQQIQDAISCLTKDQVARLDWPGEVSEYSHYYGGGIPFYSVSHGPFE